MQGSEQDPKGSIEVDPSAIIDRIDSWVDATVRSLPNIGIALLLFGLMFGIAVFAKKLIIKSARSRNRENLGEVLGGFVKASVIVLGALFAATIVFPSLSPGDLIAGLGVSSVAIGFAFKDILQNWLAGMLILLRQPFEVGDQIQVGDFEGTVDHIATRATVIKTYDGQKAVIPNSQIYSEAVLVKTGFDQRRSQYDVGIGYGDDTDEACEVILSVLSKVEDIQSEPAPQAFPWDLAASWVTIRVRWWTDSRRSDVVAVRSEVIRGIKAALDDARIDMPYETQVLLNHDQTDTTDGDRAAQREGWPAPKEGDSPSPRWKAQTEQSSS